MGSDCVVRLVVANDRAEPILDRVVEKMTELEQRWSRFIADSELSQLNDHSGAPVFVSPETFAIVSLAVDAWRATGGRFDPTLLDALRGSGYDETFDELAARAPAVGEVGERDVVVAEIAAADRRVGELRPDWILGGRRDDGTKQQCGENGFHL